jgi:hypothetical protein
MNITINRGYILESFSTLTVFLSFSTKLLYNKVALYIRWDFLRLFTQLEVVGFDFDTHDLKRNL